MELPTSAYMRTHWKELRAVTDPIAGDQRMLHFWILSAGEQRQAVRRLALSGWPESTISTATGLAIEQVRRIVADQQSGREAR
jgi:hypothetical protein